MSYNNDIIRYISSFLTYKDILNLLLTYKYDIFDIYVKKCIDEFGIHRLMKLKAYNILNNTEPEEFKKVSIVFAAQYGYIQVVQYLRDIYYITRQIPDDAVFYAAINNHLEVVKYLCEHKCFHDDAMDWAANHGHLEVVKYLYSVGAAYTFRALSCAIGNKHLEVVKYVRSIPSRPPPGFNKYDYNYYDIVNYNR